MYLCFAYNRTSYFDEVASYSITNPLIALLVIGDYTIAKSTLTSIKTTSNDYYNIIETFNCFYGYSVAFAKKQTNGDSTAITLVNNGNKLAKNETKYIDFKLNWSVDEIEDFNNELRKGIIDNPNNNFDSLIYVISSHGDGKNLIYASNGEDISLDFFYSKFNNKQCRKLRNKPKIYLCDTNKQSGININSVGISSNSGKATKTSNMNYNKTDSKDSTVTTTLASRKCGVSTESKQKHILPTAEMSPTLTATATYTADNHCRKLFGHSGHQPSVNDKNQVDSNGSVFLQAFAGIARNRSIFLNKNTSLTDVVFETRKLMAKLLCLPNNNFDLIVLHDDTTMPYDIKFGVIGSEFETKNSRVMNSYLTNYQSNFVLDNDHEQVNGDCKVNYNYNSTPCSLSAPLIAMLGISEYDDFANLECVVNDYKNVEYAFHGVRGYSYVYFNKKNKIIHKKQCKSNTDYNVASGDNIKLRWTDNEIFDFNDKICQILNSSKNNYDGLIYFISSHGDSGGIIYDSNGDKVPLITIFEKFNNQNCIKLRNKPKIYFVEACRGSMRTKRFENSVFKDVINNNAKEATKYSTTTITESATTASKVLVDADMDEFKESALMMKDDMNNWDQNKNENVAIFSKYNYNREIYANAEGYAVVEPGSKAAYMTRSITKAIINDDIFVKDFDSIMNHTRKIMLKLMGMSAACGAQVIQDNSNVPKKIFFK